MRNLRKGRAVSTAVQAAGLLLLTQLGAHADDVADFYKGKQIRLVSGQPAGSGIDVLLRTVVQHMSKYVPGNPFFVMQYMPGAGTRVAANWLYNVAPRDGSVVGSITQTSPIDQVLKEEGVQFDVAKFKWIGNAQAINNVIISWTASGLTSIEEVKRKGGLICGGSGGTTPSMVSPQLINNLAETNIRIVAGYAGNAEVFLAMERGELNCGTSSLPSMRVNFASQFREHKIATLVQMGIDKDPAIHEYEGRDVPLVVDLAQTDLDRSALNLFNVNVAFGRPILAPPGVPEDRVTALRGAFDAAMKDQAFLADAAKNLVDINPVSGARLQELAVEVTRTSDQVIARTKELTSVKDVTERKK